MKKSSLKQAVETAKTETQTALQLIANELNQGQLKKLLKNPEIKTLFERYGVTGGTK